MNKVSVLPKWTKREQGKLYIDTTSKGGHASLLSPFKIGPVMIGHDISLNMENAWQYSKVYKQHIGQDGMPTAGWWTWARGGWGDSCAHRYPMGKGSIPEYSFNSFTGKCISYIDARKELYIPLYSKAVVASGGFDWLKSQCQGSDVVLLDFDAYDHLALGRSWEEVINDPKKKMGHAFVLAMMLDGFV